MNKAIRILALVTIFIGNLASCAKEEALPLHSLARKGTEKQIKAFLSDKERVEQNINLKSDKFKYPLTEALEAGRDIAIIKLLVEAGANVLGDGNYDIPLLNAIQAANISKETILYLVSSKIDAKNSSTRENLWLAAGARGDYDIIKALVDAGLLLRYSESWQNFIEQIYASAPVSGTLLASASLQYPPLVEHESTIKGLWQQWNSQQKESPEFISVMMQLASSNKRNPDSIVGSSNLILKNWDRFLKHSAYLEKNKTMFERQKYVADYFRAAYDSIKAKPKNTATITK